jgi:hypothetical protein
MGIEREVRNGGISEGGVEGTLDGHGALGLVYLNGRSDFRLKASVVDGRE